MMWWAVFCAAVAACGAGAAGSPAPAPDALAALTPLDFVQIDPPGADDESAGYMEQALGAHYAAPWLYLLPDEPRDSQAATGRVKRRMPSLSIDMPISVLREKLSLEKERKIHALRAAANRDYLREIGKRGFRWASSAGSGRLY